MTDHSSFRIELPNGWTFSVADEMRPAICNVAAWPTDDPLVQRSADRRYFPFADDQPEHRCYCVRTVGELLQEVMNAAAPEPLLSATDGGRVESREPKGAGPAG